MFKEYKCLYEMPDRKCWQFELIDSEFTQLFIAELTMTGVDIYYPITNIYLEKGLNPAPNLALLFKFVCDKFNMRVEGIYRANESMFRYKDEINKYLLLL